jgi:hypothetical protein
MRLELHYRSDVDLSQPAIQVKIRNHIARCLRDHPGGDEGVITLPGSNIVSCTSSVATWLMQS